jgi:hypothetical protein
MDAILRELTSSFSAPGSTRESTAELLSIAYSTIAFEDVAQALGFDQEGDMTQCTLTHIDIPTAYDGCGATYCV